MLYDIGISNLVLLCQTSLTCLDNAHLGVGVRAQADPLRAQSVPHHRAQVHGRQRHARRVRRGRTRDRLRGRHHVRRLRAPGHREPAEPRGQEIPGGGLAGQGGDGGYHRDVTGAVRGLGQAHAGLLDAGGPVPREADHGAVGGVQAGAAVALAAGHGAGAAVALRLGDGVAALLLLVVVVVPGLPGPPPAAPAPPAAGAGVRALAAAAAQVLVPVLQPRLAAPCTNHSSPSGHVTRLRQWGLTCAGARGDAGAGGHPVPAVRGLAQLALARAAQQQVHPGRALQHNTGQHTGQHSC